MSEEDLFDKMSWDVGIDLKKREIQGYKYVESFRIAIKR